MNFVEYCSSIKNASLIIKWTGNENTGQALYEADVSNSYALARSGKYLKLVQGGLGDTASEILSNYIALGHTCVKDLARTYFPSSDERGPLHEIITVAHHPHADSAQSVRLNGSKHEGAHTVDSLHSTINDLHKAGLLCAVHESHFRPAADNIHEAEQAVPRDGQIKSKREEQATWELAVLNKLEDWKYGSNKDALGRMQTGTKRAYDGRADQPVGKKRKLTNSQPSGVNGTGSDSYHTEAGKLDDDLVLRVNHEKFAILMRNQQLAALVEDSISSTTKKVFAVILHFAGSQLRQCKNDLSIIDDGQDDEIYLSSLPQVSTDELKNSIQGLPDLSDALGYADPSKIKPNLLEHPKKVKRRRDSREVDTDEALVEGSASSDESDEGSDDSKSDIAGIDHDSDSTNGDADYSSKPRNHKTPDTTPDTTPKVKDPRSPLHSLRQHLLLLTEHPHRFLIPIPRQSAVPEKWAIPYRSLSNTLLHHALLSITTSRFGPLAGRLLRILGANNTNDSKPYPKLDEKMLVLLSLIPQKPMRTLLHSMHRAGHIELQELPKDGNQRRPGTTLFFWFFDPDRMRKRVLEETYKAMTNLIRRARVEREGVRVVVEKSERTDVVGREEEFLGEEELSALREWREKEERILGEVGRLDDLVAVLRDF
ncbi:MAG: hypothetical protein LQ343_008035 [Gyalolechia ehrenbergii]|nr:MAG: hypothetical protein LQ343_008035 [Gyalolechia ehrenbergii]